MLRGSSVAPLHSCDPPQALTVRSLRTGLTAYSKGELQGRAGPGWDRRAPVTGAKGETEGGR